MSLTKCGKIEQIQINKDLVGCDVIRVHFRDAVHYFSNRTPGYHMSLRQLYHYHEISEVVKVNLETINAFRQGGVESIRYEACKQVLLFKTPHGEHKIMSPLYWDARVYLLAHELLVAPQYRLLSLPQACLEAEQPLPGPPRVSVIPGCRVIIDDQLEIVKGWTDDGDNILLSSGRIVSAERISYLKENRIC